MAKKLITLLLLLFLSSSAYAGASVHYWYIYVDPNATGGTNDGGRDDPNDPNDPTRAANWTNAYTSIQTAETAWDIDLTATNRILVYCCRNSGTSGDGQVTFSGATTSTTNYIWWLGYDVPSNGQFSTSSYYLTATNATYLANPRDSHIVIDGIQFDMTLTAANGSNILNRDNVAAGGSTTVIKNCIIQVDSGGTGYCRGIRLNDTDINDVYIYNTIVHDTNSGGDGDYYGINQASIGTGQQAYILNCTISGWTGYGVERAGGGNNPIVKNCAVFNNADDFDVGVNNTYCASDDDGDRGANGVDLNHNAGGEWTASFTDYANGDFSVKDASAPIYNVGTDDPGGASQDNDDITGFTRTSTWDIGAFELDDTGGGQSSTLSTFGGPKSAGKHSGKNAGKQD